MSVKKLLNLLKNNPKLIVEICKYENILRRLIATLSIIIKLNPEDLRLQYLYSIALRIEYQGHRSSNFIQLLKNSFEIVMKKDKKGVTNTQGNAEYLFSILLMNYNMLDVTIANKLYYSFAKNSSDLFAKARYFGYILSKETK